MLLFNLRVALMSVNSDKEIVRELPRSDLEVEFVSNIVPMWVLGIFFSHSLFFSLVSNVSVWTAF